MATSTRRLLYSRSTRWLRALDRYFAVSLARVSRGYGRFAGHIRVEHVPHQRTAGLLIQRQLFNLQCPDRELIVVGGVPERWTHTPKPRLTVIRTSLHSTDRQMSTDAARQASDTRGKVDHRPMPPAAACQGIRVVDRHSKAFRFRVDDAASVCARSRVVLRPAPPLA